MAWPTCKRVQNAQRELKCFLNQDGTSIVLRCHPGLSEQVARPDLWSKPSLSESVIGVASSGPFEIREPVILVQARRVSRYGCISTMEELARAWLWIRPKCAGRYRACPGCPVSMEFEQPEVSRCPLMPRCTRTTTLFQARARGRGYLKKTRPAGCSIA
jgi:hypothetical protein